MKFPVFGRTYRNYGIINSFLADIQSLLPKAMPDAHYHGGYAETVIPPGLVRSRCAALYHR